jgi:hypothetical protein
MLSPAVAKQRKKVKKERLFSLFSPEALAMSISFRIFAD